MKQQCLAEQTFAKEEDLVLNSKEGGACGAEDEDGWRRGVEG